MTKTQAYLHGQIRDAVQKALGLPITKIQIADGLLLVEMRIEGDGAQTPFWEAVKEQSEGD